MYTTISLKFPEHKLMQKCIERFLSDPSNFTPKQTALIAWSIAKMQYPSPAVTSLLRSKLNHILRTLETESYYFEQESHKTKDTLNEMQRELQGSTFDNIF